MSDTLMPGVVDAPVNAGDASVKETPDSSAGTTSDAVDAGNGQDSAGSPQGTTEGGRTDDGSTRPRGPTKLDTIRELRAKLRERDQRYGSEIETLRSQIEELRALTQRGPGNKPSKTFWEAPEEVLEEKLAARMEALEKNIVSKFTERQQADQASAEWKQETSEAAKFIKNQGVTPEDEEDIVELIREKQPIMDKLSPMERAEYALFLWQKQRGITDKSALKAKASNLVGTPPTMNGKKMWTEQEIQNTINKFPQNPRDWTPEQNKEFEVLDREIRDAYREKRVKK